MVRLNLISLSDPNAPQWAYLDYPNLKGHGMFAKTTLPVQVTTCYLGD